MEKKILLPNRYGEKNYMINDGPNLWHFEFDSINDYGLRCGLLDDNDTNKYSFVDPSGGPFINIGYKISKNEYIDSLEWDEKKKKYIAKTKFV